MKSILMNTRAFAIAIIAILAISIAVPAKANDEKKTIPVELTFVGNIEDSPVFLLTFNNADENEFTVIVRDEFNNILYRANMKGGSKKFLLDTEALGQSAVHFEITGKKADKPVIFEINKTSRLIENVTVSKKI